MWPVIAGLGIAAASSYLNKPKKPNTSGLQMFNQMYGKQQKDLVNQQFTDLQPGNERYRTQREALGQAFEDKSAGQAEEYQKNLMGLGEYDRQAADKSSALQQEKDFRSVPMQQQMIRENLAASGGMRTGGAARAMSQPTMEAAQRSSDYSRGLESTLLERQAARAEKGVDTVYTSKAGAAMERLGIDKETLTTLYNSGRTDIINRAGQMLGISQQELANMLAVEGIQINAGLADNAASNERNQQNQNALMQLLGQFAGSQSGSSKSDVAK